MPRCTASKACTTTHRPVQEPVIRHLQRGNGHERADQVRAQPHHHPGGPGAEHRHHLRMEQLRQRRWRTQVVRRAHRAHRDGPGSARDDRVAPAARLHRPDRGNGAGRPGGVPHHHRPWRDRLELDRAALWSGREGPGRARDLSHRGRGHDVAGLRRRLMGSTAGAG